MEEKINKLIILITLAFSMIFVFCYGNQSETILAYYAFEEGDWDTPTGWRIFGDVPLATWSELVAISGNRCIGLLDNDDSSYSQWQSEPIQTSDGPQQLHLAWQELYDVSSGQMRLTVLILNRDNDIIDQIHFTVSGKSQKYDVLEFSKRSEIIDIPENSNSIILVMVSGGQSSAVGKYYIDNIKLTSTDKKNIHDTNAHKENIIPIAYWDMEQEHNLYDDRPKGWEYSGNIPYQATWTCDAANSGIRSLKIEDNDAGSHGMWFTSRTTIPENTSEIEVSANLKLKNIQGKWKIVVCYYDIGTEHNYSQTFYRIDGIIEKNKKNFTLQWSTVDPDGMTPLFTTRIPETERNSKGFWQVKVNLPVDEKAKCFRVGIMSGWEPANTGCAWLDDLGITAIQKF